MAVGNSRKLKLDESLEKFNAGIEDAQTSKEDVVRLYKDKNHRVKKELRFESKMNKSKLA
ncbi:MULTISPECIES: hypothetical protein [Maribacter]|jgi:hypothetical protein|uniref:Uncharacterized protein n=1 Tax=Maribacter stanieri TaxID=440514 RepID=A0A1I6I5A4_9FLAO|nr:MULTISPECIES: hypothetical protein [Maribacter]MDO6470769.1 hypothetical protein [Maribacter sp. 1_MG-2023]MDP5062360.1 hypothetical protein [Maribacter sp.]SFR61560.1 hypothetical protein SAMN04488010_1096 [Maribacter stanieri]